jgi:maltoporin
MKALKLLPISAAVLATLGSGIAIANDSDEGFYFSGYARYGAHYAAGDEAYVAPVGALNGASAGRLGNESNGGEFQFGNKMTSDNGTNWDVAVMLEHWGDTVGLKKFYAKANNVFESQPGMTVWAGRDFHQRPQTGLNDYFWMTHDGQGGGFTDLQIGGIAFDASVVGQVDGGGTGDNGNYAFTSKLHGIGLGDVGSLSFLFNYGFASDAANGRDIEEDGAVVGNTDDFDGMTSYQLAAVMDFNHTGGWNQVILRYTDGAQDSVFMRNDDISTTMVHWEGGHDFTDKFELGYVAAYQNLTNDEKVHNRYTDTDASRTNYNAIVRPMYSWNNIHSTWVEAGYSVVDYKDDGTNSAWKATLSQNISFGEAKSGDRPMLRFYATVGDATNEVTDLADKTELDTVSVGAMFEAWW